MEIKRDYDFIVRMKKKDTRKAEELFGIHSKVNHATLRTVSLRWLCGNIVHLS